MFEIVDADDWLVTTDNKLEITLTHLKCKLSYTFDAPKTEHIAGVTVGFILQEITDHVRNCPLAKIGMN